VAALQVASLNSAKADERVRLVVRPAGAADVDSGSGSGGGGGTVVHEVVCSVAEMCVRVCEMNPMVTHALLRSGNDDSGEVLARLRHVYDELWPAVARACERVDVDAQTAVAAGLAPQPSVELGIPSEAEEVLKTVPE
jgi:hypothetical protein